MAQPSARRRLVALLAGLSVVLALLALWPARDTQESSATEEGRQRRWPSEAGPVGSAVPPSAPDGPSSQPVPGRYTRDRAGAEAAAVAFVKLSETFVAMDQPAAVSLQRAIASESGADALAAEVGSKLQRLHAAWPPGTMTYRVAPLAVRLVPDGPDAFRADVWYVGVVEGRNLTSYDEWVTESYRLVWERGDWRMASRTVTRGPRPEASPTPTVPTAQMDALLAGFGTVAP